MPKVSVITPCFNAERYLERTLASVGAQTLADWEHIVIDDGSIDGSAEIVRRRAAIDGRARLLQQPNGGMGNARNAGFAAAAASPYLLFLDADDTLEPAMLRMMTDYLDTRPTVGLAYCIFRPIDAEDLPLEGAPSWMDVTRRAVPTWRGIHPLETHEPETPFESIMYDFCAIPSSWVMRRSVFERTLRWDETASYDDKDMALQMAMLAPVHLLPQHLVNYRRHDSNMSITDPLWIKNVRGRTRWWRDQTLPAVPPGRGRRAVLLSRWAQAQVQLRAAARSVRERQPRQAASQALQGTKHATALLLGYAGVRAP